MRHGREIRKRRPRLPIPRLLGPGPKAARARRVLTDAGAVSSNRQVAQQHGCGRVVDVAPLLEAVLALTPLWTRKRNDGSIGILSQRAACRSGSNGERTGSSVVKSTCNVYVPRVHVRKGAIHRVRVPAARWNNAV